MNNYERKETEKLVIKAIEDFLNSNEYKLSYTEITNLTSAYYLLDIYKNELIEKVYGK